MGIPIEVRNHLFNLFQRAFRRCLENNRQVDLAIIDGMQFLKGRILTATRKKQQQRTINRNENGKEEEGGGGHGREDKIFFNPITVANSVKETVDEYLSNSKSQYSITKGLVFCLDSIGNVPSNKSTTQMSRDNVTTTTTTTTTEQQQKKNKITVMDEVLYNEHIKDLSMEELNYLLINESFGCEIDGDLIWRSTNLKSQLFRVTTMQLCHCNIPEGVKLVIDDGIYIKPDEYSQLRERMIRDYNLTEAPAFIQECLATSLIRRDMTHVVSLDKRSEPLLREATGLGEADVKIPRFIAPRCAQRGTGSYMVISQDTDLLFILLLHMKNVVQQWSNNNNGGGDEEIPDTEFELWLDSQTPADRNAGISRPYRFVNIKRLYYDMLGLFAEEFPTLENPVETMALLTYSLNTDYTNGFDKYLGITHKKLWNIFSALHSGHWNQESEKWIPREDYILFNQDVIDTEQPLTTKTRPKLSAVSGVVRNKPGGGGPDAPINLPRELYQVLRTAVTIDYDSTADLHRITMDDIAWQRFFYFLCQFKVIYDLAILGNTEFSANSHYRKFILDRDELFSLAQCITEKVSNHRALFLKAGDNNNNTTTMATATIASKKRHHSPLYSQSISTPKKMKLSNAISSSKRSLPINKNNDSNETMALLNTIEEIDDDIDSFDQQEEAEVDAEKTSRFMYRPRITSDEGLKRLATAKVQPKDQFYGIPQLNAMLARIYRMEWLVNYHQNGPKDPSYKTNFFERSPTTGLSIHGWEASEIFHDIESYRNGSFNNTYYTSIVHQQQQKDSKNLPCSVYTISETNQVHNRNAPYYSGIMH